MSTIKNYFSLVKFSHTIFAMPFAMIGFFIAVPVEKKSMQALSDQAMLWKLLLVVICMITARSAAMAFNRYLDRNFDKKNPRTAIREIPAGILSAESAMRFVIINCMVFVLATYFINPICFYLSPIALFVILFYSYTKRFTPLCHLVLGLGLSLAPIGAYLAVTGSFALLPILFSFTVIFWVSGFDIIYALQDVDFDQSQQLYSIPTVLGKASGLRVSELLHLLSAICIIVAGYIGEFHWIYWIGVLIFIGMLIFQHRLVKPNDLSRVNLAFMTANGIASIVFGAIVIGAIFLQYGW
ncbi:MAG: UbiA-like polyprenyltransferase [Sediminibacterium sp.]|nr:UbiA-like polyprenyltransferase [Sediminibacterium sp.]